MVGSNIGGVRTAVWNHRHGDPVVCCKEMDASASAGRSARVAVSVKVREESWMPTAPGAMSVPNGPLPKVNCLTECLHGE